MFNVIDEFNVLFSEDKTTLIKAPSSLAGEYIIPDCVTNISNDAFYKCEKLEKIVLPPMLESLGWRVFSGCNSLCSVVLPHNLISIGGYCFAGCKLLQQITIPATTKHIGEYAFEGCSSLREILIPTICSCDKYAFKACAALESIQIPDTWNEIPSGLFYSCSGLEHIVLPVSVKSIGTYAFSNCSGLLFFDTGDGVETIRRGAFEWCNNLREIRFGQSVKELEGPCFEQCTNLQVVFWDAIECNDFSHSKMPFAWGANVTEYWPYPWPSDFAKSVISVFFGRKVKRIPSYLCAGLSNLEAIAIPDSVTYIGEAAFACCNPKRIYLNKNITPELMSNIFGYHEMGESGYIWNVEFFHNMFYYCDRIEEIVVSQHNSFYASKDGSLYDKNFSKLIKIGQNNVREFSYGNDKIDRVLYVKADAIEDFAGFGLQIDTLDVDGCSSIGKYSFYQSSLRSLRFTNNKPVNCKSAAVSQDDNQQFFLHIDTFAFGGCRNLQEIHWDVEGDFPMSASVKFFGRYRGEDCDSDTMRFDFSEQIKKFTLGNNITKLPAFAALLRGVKELSVPANIKDVAGGLPPTLQMLKVQPTDGERHFIFENGFVMDKSGCILFRYVGDAKAIIIPDGIAVISDNALSYTSAQTIALPDSIVSIGKCSFLGAELEEFTAPVGLKTIGDYAFKDCQKLQSVSLNSALKHIGYEAFANCVELKKIPLPESADFDYNSLEGCSALEELQINSDIMSLNGLSSLKQVIWNCPDSKDWWCGNTIFVSEKRYDSGNVCFDRERSVAHHIESVIITNNVKCIPSHFADYMPITEIDIPKSVTSIGTEAFFFCPNLERINIHSMDFEFEMNFCHFGKTMIKLDREYVPCPPTKIFFEGKDVTDYFLRKNSDLIDDYNRSVTSQADFEQYLKDSFYGAYEGECDPNGDFL